LQASISLTNSGPFHKWQHLTALLALSGIKEELGNIGSIYQSSTEAKIALSKVQQKMIESQMAPQTEMDWIMIVQKMFHATKTDCLSNEAILTIVDIFMLNEWLAMFYIQLSLLELCRLWVDWELHKMNFMDSLR
jgi:hypothetical protein